MILINLLPYREEKRKRRKTAFFAGLALSALVGALVVAAVMLVLQQLTAQQAVRNQYLSNEITRLEGQIKDIANLKAEIESLKSRQSKVEDLQADRNTPVHLLNELAKLVPEGVYLTSIKQADKVITLTGLAQTNERVSEFMRNTTRSSEWLDKPELLEVRLANVAANTRDQKRLFDFSMKVLIKTPQAEPAPGTPGQKKG
ncbi:PilN domain-containing protein [Paucibacter sp. APW11]|uniref:PilN domain-containing protein n=1 Tax=Roseateles aquae TaxID=3077235 RepID=A0ABU3PHW4_9BURK|nr:PilN domain-containing protein [Paucibacter sp. APW11]MDT9002151.1 PilN domain-containing protein [Paucibacter sp. APW11]